MKPIGVLFLFIFLLLPSVSLSEVSQVKSPLILGYPNRSGEYKYVSLLRLLTSPEKYDGKKIVTEGILFTGKDASYLFLYTEDLVRSRLDNAFSLIFKFDPTIPDGWGFKLHRKRILVEATLTAPSEKLVFGTGGGRLAVSYIREIREGVDFAAEAWPQTEDKSEPTSQP